MPKKKRRLITAALPYVNFVPHLGHLAGSHLPADIFARYCRLQGHETLLIGGTDENGTATETTAHQLQITPKKLCNHFYKIHKDIYKWFNISYDNFSRTSKEIHYQTTQEVFLNNFKNGFMQEKIINIPFSQPSNIALADRYIEGTCPHCGYEFAKGDQCESCSKLLDPLSLKNPKPTIEGETGIIFKKKKHIFFRLDKFSKNLDSWLNKQEHWRPQVRNLAKAWIRDGLKPRDITRDLTWGVPVPLKDYKDSILYVWYDAPIGYISSTKEWAIKKKKPQEWKKYWTKDTQYYCFIGKDNIPFHSIFFPGILLADKRFILPYNVVGLQYLNYERAKFSKSKGHGIFCDNLQGANLDPDYWRFYISLVLPETKDTEFLWEDFKNKINAELIGNFSNFINRTLTFIYKHNNKTIPKPKLYSKAEEKELQQQIQSILNSYEKVELREALNGILKLSSMGNKLFDQKEIWNTKDEASLFLLANLCKSLGLLIQPFLPDTSKKILSFLNCKEKDFSALTELNLGGKKIKKPEILFKKLEQQDIETIKSITSKVSTHFEKQKDLKSKDSKRKIMANDKGEISIEDIKEVKIKIGTIKEVNDHPSKEHLYILKVHFSEKDTKQVVSGLKKHYTKKDLLNKQAPFIINLQEADFDGVKSQAMILAAQDKKKNLAILTTDHEKKVKDNAKVS